MGKKVIIIFAILCFIIVVALIVKVPSYVSLMIANMGSSHIAKDKVVKDFNENKTTFIEIENYLKGFKENLTIDKDKDKDKSEKYTIEKVQDSKVSLVEVEDKKIGETISFLLDKLKYKHVVKDGNGGSSGNCILFLRQTDIGYEQGIAFSIDGNKPNWPLINVLVPIEGNWYYYESK